MATVTLHPGDNIQNAINTNPTGTIFSLTDGTYRGVSSLVPKDGDQFIGSPNAILNGSILLTGRWTQSGSLYLLGGLPAPLPTSGVAGANTPIATHPQDLFVNDVLYQRVSSTSNLGPGKWYFDESNRVAYTSDNLNGKTVEISNTQAAISSPGSPANVVLQGFTVEKYASPAQHGAVSFSGSGWTVKDMTIMYNHGAGLGIYGVNATVQSGHLNNNGQEGYNTYHSDGLVMNGVEVAGNNYAGFKFDWEAGGGKLTNSINVKLTNNNVHDNNGVGIWDDINDYQIEISGNKVDNNAYNGIMTEISYDTTIHDNTVVGNGLGYVGQGVIPAQIVIQNAQNTDVYNNFTQTAAAHGNGIALTYDSSRGSGNRGTYNTTNNKIHNNTEVFTGFGGANGIISYRGSTSGFVNTWSNNSFNVTNASHQVFDNLGSYMTLPQAQSAGFEQGSTETVAGDDTLVLDLSEDAYQGDAQFQVKLDGSVIAGPLTVQAIEPTQHQAFTFDIGMLANGSHSVAIDFLNDAYGGTSSTDRNLYVNAVTVNGTQIGGSHPLYSNGEAAFLFTDNNHQITPG